MYILGYWSRRDGKLDSKKKNGFPTIDEINKSINRINISEMNSKAFTVSRQITFSEWKRCSMWGPHCATFFMDRKLQRHSFSGGEKFNQLQNTPMQLLKKLIIFSYYSSYLCLHKSSPYLLYSLWNWVNLNLKSILGISWKPQINRSTIECWIEIVRFLISKWKFRPVHLELPTFQASNGNFIHQNIVTKTRLRNKIQKLPLTPFERTIFLYLPLKLGSGILAWKGYQIYINYSPFELSGNFHWQIQIPHKILRQSHPS